MLCWAVGWALPRALITAYGPFLGFVADYSIGMVTGMWVGLWLGTKLGTATWNAVSAPQRQWLYWTPVAVYALIGAGSGYLWADPAMGMAASGLIGGLFGYWERTRALRLERRTSE